MFLNSLRVGWFLAIRYFTRSNIWASALIIFIMLLTFLNVVVVRGVLVGLPTGASLAYERQYTGAVLISALPERRTIEETDQIEVLVTQVPGYVLHSKRLIGGGQVEANYKTIRKSSDLADTASTEVVGINPIAEDTVTNLSDLVIEGRYLTNDDHDGVLIGSELLDRFVGFDIGVSTLAGVYPGENVRITLGGNEREFEVLGIVKSKVNDVSRRAYVLDTTARNMLERFDRNVNEIAIRTDRLVTKEEVRDAILAGGAASWAQVETSNEAQGSFLEDVINTFDILSGMIGFIGLSVAAITVFIIIFINAIARKRQIGILKGIGIDGTAVEISYVFLSFFYAVIGIVLGFLLLTFVLEPYVAKNPIDFPFSDGILVAPLDDTLMRSLWIMIATILAGYIPARMIVRRNTINAILGK